MQDERGPERVVERPTTTVVESRRSGFGVVLGIILVILAAVAVYFIVVNANNEGQETEAVTEAARAVGQAAESVGETAETATDELQQPETR